MIIERARARGSGHEEGPHRAANNGDAARDNRAGHPHRLQCQRPLHVACGGNGLDGVKMFALAALVIASVGLARRGVLSRWLGYTGALWPSRLSSPAPVISC
jgi:hypothetical protein